jgi:hypothetical protein
MGISGKPLLQRDGNPIRDDRASFRGRYRLVVRAADVRRNWSQRTFAIRVRAQG